MLLLLAAASVIVLSALCGLKLDLSVSPCCLSLLWVDHQDGLAHLSWAPVWSMGCQRSFQ